MLAISRAALEQLRRHLDGQRIDSAIRIALMKGTCSGPSLHFSIDEANADDHVLEQGGIRFLINKVLAASCGLISIDFHEHFDRCPCSGRNGGFLFSCQNNDCCAEGRCASCCPDNCQFRCQLTGSADCFQPESCAV
jgi:Fe-S cluster assembly iron-binding protein IscA